MNSRRYWKSRLPFLLTNLVCMAALTVFLLVCGNSVSAVVLVLIVWALILLTGLVLTYWKRKRQMKKLLDMAEQLSERYLISEVMELPEQAEDQVYYQLLKMAGKSMLEQIGEVERERLEYKEYIEQWIHEIKTPITAMKLLCENHRMNWTKELLLELEKTNRFTEQALYYARSEHTEKDYSVREMALSQVVHQAIADTVDLGEDFYNFQSVIYIVPDHICNKLTSANTFRYMMADKTISYDIAQELKSYFENSSLTDSLVTYNITMRTIEVNDNSAVIFIMQTGLTYSAIILFVTCFTILALQQLSDSGKYKYRFRVLRNMGVEEPHIRKLILKQLAVWFGVPVILALILSGAFLVFLFVGFHMQIAVYIGVQRLVQQLLIVLAILDVLLISYFISTWVLFNKSASA